MIKINVDTRYWQIPKEEAFLGVESDDKVKILQFELSKNEFYDGLNFTDCNCFINYKNEDNDTIPYGITDMEVHEDGTVTFTWKVSRGATIFKGNTFAVLCVKKVREDGTITNEWNSRIGSFTVAKGLEPSSSITEVPEIDIISQLLLVAQQTNANAQNNIEQSNSLLEKAEGLGYLKEKYDVLEARMNQFTSLKEGSTTGDAELQDIRVGKEGKKYDTAGDAVRGQIGELKGDIDDYVNGLSHKTKSIHIEWELGYITQAGVEGASNTSARTKDILHISKGDIVRYSSEGYKTLNVFLYNSDGSFDSLSNWTSVFGNLNEDITIANDVYCRFSSALSTGAVITDPTSQMQNVFSLTQGYGYARIDYLEQEAEKAKDNSQRIVALEHNVELLQNSSAIVVAKDGSGDFTTIQEAVDYAQDNDTILVMPGVYEEMVTTKINVSPWQKYVHIRGYDKYRCILQTHTNERLLEPLTMSIGSVSNMTIKNLYDETQPHEQRRGYCIHVDINTGIDVSRNNFLLEDCIFYSENGDVLGCGLWDNWIFEVRNCVLESAEISSNRCFAIHNTMAESSCKVILDGNRIFKNGECVNGKLVSFMDVRNGQDYNSIIVVYAHNNTVYDFYNDTSDSVYVGTTNTEKGWDNQTQFILSKESYGNNTSLLNK